jgi:protein-S-isoprenylcysteine O-methyltransferase Ste14
MPPERKSFWLRAWLGVPDWMFRVIGATLSFAYAFERMRDYREFPYVGPWWAPPMGTDAFGVVQYGTRHYFPIAKILTDLTFLLIGLSFCFRLPPRQRAHTARQIVIPLIGGIWPFLPFVLLFVLEAIGSPAATRLNEMLALGRIGLTRFYISVVLLSAGLALDVWGYWTVLPSFSIVAEARELKVNGPYRFARHPIYLGQIISQGALWLILIELHWVWVAFFLIFAVIQLYRARVEETVLEDAFGESYRRYKQRTFWLT